MSSDRPAGRAGTYLKRGLLFLGVLLVCGEIAVRVAVLQISPMTRNVAEAFRSDPVTGFRLASNLHKRVDIDPIEFHFTFDTNSRGLRGPEITTKAPGEYRVLVLGDSFAFGLGVEANETFSAVLQRQLQGAVQRPVRVINAGTVSFGTIQELAFLKAYANELQPDLVVLAFYDNDFADNVSTIVFRDGYLFENPILFAGHPSFLVEFVLKDLLHIHGRRTANVETVTRELLEQMQQTCADRHVPFVLLDVTNRETTRWAIDSHQVHRPAPAPSGAVFIDLFDRIQAEPATPYLKEHHLNKRGHELVASELFPVALRAMTSPP